MEARCRLRCTYVHGELASIEKRVGDATFGMALDTEPALRAQPSEPIVGRCTDLEEHLLTLGGVADEDIYIPPVTMGTCKQTQLM